MSNLFEHMVNFWKSLAKGQSPLPVVAFMPKENCKPDGAAGYAIRRDEMYFTVRINEMYLAENREWWSVYDPLVIVVCEFNYKQERVAIPTVVGPNLIQKLAPKDKPLHGVVILDTLVAGPYPYRGGDVDISVALYQVQRVNYAQTILKIVDTLSSYLKDVSEMEVIAKTGAALLAGVEGLLGMSETKYLAGHRASMATSPVEPFIAGFSALITPKAPEVSDLCVIDNRLRVRSKDSPIPYRDSDFVLLSISGSEARGDESKFSFYKMKTDALAALWDGKGGNERAKANLIAAYQQMRKSPEITTLEATRLFDSWLAEFEKEKKRVSQVREMPTKQRPPEIAALVEDLNSAALRLERLV